MTEAVTPRIQSFLLDADEVLCPFSLLKLNVILNGMPDTAKPYKIDYTILLLSYQKWQGKDLEEFCHKQTISYFMFNPENDSAEAREALFFDIREFLLGV